MADASEYASRIRYLISEIIDSKIREHAEEHTFNLSSTRLENELETAIADMFRDAQAGPQPAPPPEPEPAPEPEHLKWGKLAADYHGLRGSFSIRVSKCQRYSIRVEKDGWENAETGHTNFRHYYLYRGVFPGGVWIGTYRQDRQAREAAEVDLRDMPAMLDKACSSLIEGKPAVNQPLTVQEHLVALSDAGRIENRGGVWYRVNDKKRRVGTR